MLCTKQIRSTSNSKNFVVFALQTA